MGDRSGRRVPGKEAPTFEHDLGNGFVMRSVGSEVDIRRFVTFHERLFDTWDCVAADSLMRHHPYGAPSDFLYVEDKASGEIASTVCLVPWRCRYDEVTLEVAQLEAVATDPRYRRRGLVRALMQRFGQMTNERGCHLAAIGGIPYYYRRFGYTYAVDSLGSVVLPASRLPDALSGGEAYSLRAATVDDAPVLDSFYRQATAGVQFHDLRDESFWRYLLQWGAFPARLIVEVNSGQAVGYVATTGGLPSLHVIESAVFDHDVVLAVLRLLRAEAGCELQVSGWQGCALPRQALAICGSQPHPYQWLLKVVDVPRFLTAIAPVLRRRLAGTQFERYSARLRLNLFDQAYALSFEHGLLVRVEPLGFVDTSYSHDGGEIQLPPDAFVRLALGYRGVDQLRDAWPDIAIAAPVRPLVDALFPLMTSHLSLPYGHFRPSPRPDFVSPDGKE